MNHKKTKIKEMIRRLHQGEDAQQLKEEYGPVIRQMDVEDIARIEQELIEEGMDARQIEKLCDLHLLVLKESLGSVEGRIENSHSVSTLTAEHQHILRFVEDLDKLSDEVQEADSAGQVAEQLEKIEHIARHLVEVNLHHQREEDVLFPRLREKGIVEPVDMMVSDHNILKPAKKELLQLVENHNNYDWDDFKKKLDNLAGIIKTQLPSHIYKEDNILYPLALKLIDEDQWEAMQKDFDHIGYCCFTPGRVKSHQ